MSTTGEERDENAVNQGLTAIGRARSSFLYLIGLMIAFGNWNDTKEISITIYQVILKSFTHQVEEAKVHSINVGNYLPYIEKSLGPPRVIKPSKNHKGVQFRYYHNDKYLLTLMAQGDRIQGVLVQAMNVDSPLNLAGPFAPTVPYTNIRLSTQKLSEIPFEDPRINYDNHNLTYYMERHELDKSGMFLALYLGRTEYGEGEQALGRALSQLSTSISVNPESSYKAVRDIRESFSPNFYSISELSSETVAESLLTTHEIKTLFK
ncbi:ETEC_3214 domain-containing protein [Ferrimonas sp.]|uniref:ETEC_3214 domain-containing protein n=1 Tax=Ferrimonas sp. TaxID=2080861 RepID=UPI003A8ED955